MYVANLVYLALILILQDAASGRIFGVETQVPKMIWHDIISANDVPNVSDIKPDARCLNKSSFVKKDIEAIIDYIYDELKLNETIIKSYGARALEVRKKHMDELEIFVSWFKLQPEHLKHIIDDIAARRKFLEPKIKKNAVLLKSQEEIQKRLKQQQLEVEKLSLKLKKIKNICDANCAEVRFRRSAEDDFYCGTAVDIQKEFISEVVKYVNISLKAELSKKIEDLDKKYVKDIENLENKIKEIAIKDYGHVMVDILRIQDEYFHYYQLFQTDMYSYKNELDESVLKLDGKLLQLGTTLEKYKKYCLQCADSSYPNMFSRTYLYKKETNQTYNNTPQSPRDLLKLVINAKIENIHHQSVIDIEKFFSKLDMKIHEIEHRDTNVTNFKPIQGEIKAQLDKEYESFNQLKKIVSEESVQNFLSLKSVSSKLSNTIDDLLAVVKKLNKE